MYDDHAVSRAKLLLLYKNYFHFFLMLPTLKLVKHLISLPMRKRKEPIKMLTPYMAASSTRLRRTKRRANVPVRSSRTSWRMSPYSSVRSIFNLLPSQFRIRMANASTFSLTGGATTETKYLTPNSGTDPMGTCGSTQSQQYDAFSRLYTKYYVESFRVVVEPERCADGSMFSLTPSWSSTAPTNFYYAMSQPYAQYSILRDDNTTSKGKVTLNVRCRNFMGTTYDPSGDSAIFSASPTNLLYVHINWQSATSGNLGTDKYIATVIQNFVFFQPKYCEDEA